MPTASLAVLPAATAVLWHARQSRTPTGRKVSLGGCNHPQDTTWFMGVGAGRPPVTFDTVQAHRKVKGQVTRAGQSVGLLGISLPKNGRASCRVRVCQYG